LNNQVSGLFSGLNQVVNQIKDLTEVVEETSSDSDLDSSSDEDIIPEDEFVTVYYRSDNLMNFWELLGEWDDNWTWEDSVLLSL